MDRERAKTLILSLLVILSIMSLHKIWFDSPMSLLQSEASNGREQRNDILDIRDQVIAPKKSIIGFGGSISNNYYTVVNYQETKLIWEKSKLLLFDFFAEEPNILKVSIDEYVDNRRKQSIELEFGKGIPSVLIASTFNILDNKIINDIPTIRKILIPVNNKGTIFISSGDYDADIYQITLTDYENSTLENFINEYERKGFVKYYTIFSYANNVTTLMPVSYNKTVVQPFIQSEIDIKDEDAIVAKTKSFFNENFDFVKTIRETSGSIIYLYGYGEKSVRINNRGQLNYNQEMVSISSTNVLEALDVALDFIDKHDDMPEGAYLSEIKDVSSVSNRGYYFGFSYDIEGYPLAHNNMLYPIEIEVYGNSVKSYKSFIRKKMNLAPNQHREPILSPYKIIEDNIKALLDNYKRDLDNNTKDGIIDTINLESIEDTTMLENVNRIELVYFDSNEEIKKQLVKPRWLIGIGDRLYYFDSYNGKLLHSTIAN